MSDESNDILYIKAHDAWQLLPGGYSIFPNDITKGVVYIIRNPVDAAISFSYHNGKGSIIAKSSQISQDVNLAKSHTRLSAQLSQYVGSWEKHVKSWTEDSKLPCHIVRYESLKQSPFETFKDLVKFLKIDADDEQIKLAVQNSSLNELIKQEKEKGFIEKPIKAKEFFREGKINYFKESYSQYNSLTKKIDKNLLRKFHYNYGKEEK